MTDESKKWNEGFEAGYCCAVANIMRSHEEETIAIDVLKAGCPSPVDHIDESDQKILQPLWKQIKKQW